MPAEPPPLSPEIRAEPTIGGHRYVLPRRRLGAVGAVARTVALAAGIAVAGVLAFLGVRVAGVLNGGASWSAVMVPGFIAVFIVSIAVPAGRFALLAWAGHAEIEVRSGDLRCAERAGPVRRTRAIPGSEITRLEMRAAGSGVLRGIVALAGGESTKRPVVVGYPSDLLVGLTAALGDDLGVETSVDLDAKLVRPEPEGGVRGEPERPAPQPPKSSASVTRDGDAVSIELPPLGVRKGGKGLFSFAVLWNLICWPIAGGFAYVGVKDGATGALVASAFVALIFGGVGVWVTVEVVRMGRRRAFIDVVDGVLLISTRTPFGSRQRQWAREDVVSVKVGETGTEVNERAIRELQVRSRAPDGSEEKAGFLRERPDGELYWLASEIRAALGGRGGHPGTGV